MTFDENPTTGFVQITVVEDFAVLCASVTIEELYDLCLYGALSLGALKEKQLHKLLLGKDKEGFIVSYYEYPFFHEACMNEKVTLEIIEYLLSIFPQ